MSLRDQIMEEVKDLFEYAGVFRVVERHWTEMQDIPADSFPALIIEDDGPETIRHKTGDLADVTFVVHMIAYVKAEQNLATAINDIDQHIKELSVSNPTFLIILFLVTNLPTRISFLFFLPI